MNLAAFLVAMVGPMAARVLASLGVSLVALSGATAAYQTLKGQLVASLGGLPADAIQIGGACGIWSALGILLGAYLFSLTWASTKGFWSLAKV